MPRITAAPLAGAGFKGVSRARGFTGGGSNVITVAGNSLTNDVGTTAIVMGSGNFLRVGQKLDTNCALLNYNVNTYRVRLAKNVGSATGTATIRIRNSGDVAQVTIGTQDVSLLTGSFTDYTYTLSGSSYQILLGDRALVEYAAGDTSNNIILAYDPSTVVDSNRTYTSRYDTTYGDLSGTNTRFSITTTTSGLGGSVGIVIG